MSRRLKAPREPKVQPKRTHPLEKAWYILKPFILYMVIKTAALLLLSLLVISVPISSMAEWVTVHSNQINAVLNALASIFAVAFLMNDFLKEVNVIGEIDIDSSFFRQFCAWMKNGVKADKDKAVPLALSASLGITSALAFNILAGIIQIQSPGYQKVEAIQYSVPIWLGLILYGLISPFVEEVVFRGLTYTRMRRFFGIPLSVIVTAVLFAGFHGNLAQFVYALCMGVLLALCYEWVKSFAAPLVFHMAANIVVFVVSSLMGGSFALLYIPFLVFFLLLSVILTALLYGKTR